MSLFVAKSPSVFVFFFWEGVDGVGVQGLWGMVLFGAFGGFLLGYSGCTFDNWLVDRLHKNKIEEKNLFMSVIQNHRDYLSEHRGNSC